MTNEAIAEYFSLLSKLMDIHGDNSFKSKSYANAAFQIDRLPEPLINTNKNDWAALRGVGSTLASKIEELIETGSLKILDEYIEKTPEGVVQMLQIKGLGPKKINTVWKEMEIESIGELLYACNENRLILFKGFGEKTQQNVKDAIIFMMAQQGKFLYQQAETFIAFFEQKLEEVFGQTLKGITGEMRRHSDIINRVGFLVALPKEEIQTRMEAAGYISESGEEAILYKLENAPTLELYPCTENNAGTRQFILTGNDAFIDFMEIQSGLQLGNLDFKTEEALFSETGIPFILPQHREIASNELHYKKYVTKPAASPATIKGIIHCHSKWSDGSNTLQEMAEAAKAKGYEYLVISDHSRAATYAGGLTSERVFQQHAEIDVLNQKLAPFKIFKSIECDILGDGQLDYDEVLQNFDLVITSVHSGLRMTEEKAMLRLIRAIENSYTIILGHMTGRLLLSRNGYPVDHKKIIDACAANQVVIELNAHPRRLDMDWTFIPYALEKEVIISIDPDAHSIEGFDDIRYGCIAAEKALLPAASNLSSFTLSEFEEWLYEVRGLKGTLS